jgi:hypothetical protein
LGTVASYLAAPSRSIEVNMPTVVPLEPRDPVFRLSASGEYSLVGEVSQVDQATERADGKVRIQLRDMTGGQFDKPMAIQFHSSDRSGLGVLRTLLPPAKQTMLMKELSLAWASRKERTEQILSPVLRQVMGDIYPVLEAEVEKSVVRHGDQMWGIVERHRRDYWSAEFGQLAQDVAWPLVRTKAQPVMDRLAGEIFQRVSVWRLGWRYLADKVGVGGGSLEQEWSRFVSEDALPIIESRMTELADVATSVLTDAAADPRVQETLRLSLHRLVEDPAVQDLMGQIARESLLDNSAVAEAVSRTLDQPTVAKAWADLASEWETVAVSLVQKILSDQDGEISPELARVLRSSLLGKDLRWLVIQPERSDSISRHTLLVASDSAGYPLPTRRKKSPE